MNLRKYWRISFDGDKKYINSFADVTVTESNDFVVELESTDRYSLKDFIKAANKNLSSGQIKDLNGINFLYRYPGISLSSSCSLSKKRSAVCLPNHSNFDLFHQ